MGIHTSPSSSASPSICSTSTTSGAEKRSDWVLEQLYALVNERYEAERSMLVTTNLGQEELERQIGPRTVSRLVEICGDPLLFGPDKRIEAGGTSA